MRGLDLARSRADDWDHAADPLPRDFADVYGSTPAWHDAHLELHGPAVGQVEQVFRERWSDPQPMTMPPQHPTALPAPSPPPPPEVGGQSTVQLLRTYPHQRRTRRFPFAPEGEFSAARWFVKALHRNPALHIITVRPRHPDYWAAACRCGSCAPACAIASLCWTSKTPTARRSTSMPKSPSSTTCGPASEALISTAAPGPMTPSSLSRCSTTKQGRSIPANQSPLQCGQLGLRPPGRLRRHDLQQGSAWQLALASPLYRSIFDSDGRPLRYRLTPHF